MSVRAMLEQFPSLQQCLCVWLEEVEEVEEVEPCRSLQALTTQCHQKPGAVFSASLFPIISETA